MPFQGLRIIDCHAHFPVRNEPAAAGPARLAQAHPAIRTYNEERTRRMRQEWDFPEPAPPAFTAEEAKVYADAYIADLDRWGVDRIIWVTGASNERLASICRHYPERFIGLAHHRIDEEGALDALQLAVEEYGFRGLKMFGPTLSVPFEDPSLRPIWTYLADRKLPVLVHFGTLGHGGGVVYHPRMSPLTLDPVAREFLDIPFIIPHFGCSYMWDLLQLCWALPNIHVDTSGSNQWMDWMPWPMDVETAFRKFYERIGPERILFGTDSSWRPRGFVGRYLQDQVRACRNLALPEQAMQLIFSGNAARLFQIER